MAVPAPVGDEEVGGDGRGEPNAAGLPWLEQAISRNGSIASQADAR